MYYSLISSMKKASAIVFDPDATAFITATGITDTTQKSAINTLVLDFKSYGIWSKMKAIYPMVGGTATTHKFNLKDPRDLDAAYRLTFFGGGTHSSTGYLPNGTTSYANTYITPSVDLSLNSVHMSYYSRTNTVGTVTTKTELGVYSSGSALPLLHMRIKSIEGGLNNRAVSHIWSYNTGQAINVPVTYDSTGFFVNTRSSSTSHKFLRNNSLIASITSANDQTTMPTRNLLICAFNENGTIARYTDRECAFSSIGTGLTDTEMTNSYTAVQAFNTTLLRQI